jgi:hypothetical protein
MTDTVAISQTETDTLPKRELTPAAARALAEADQRRAGQLHPEMPVEINGRGGLDPARFGDWEIKGLAIDF